MADTTSTFKGIKQSTVGAFNKLEASAKKGYIWFVRPNKGDTSTMAQSQIYFGTRLYGEYDGALILDVISKLGMTKAETGDTVSFTLTGDTLSGLTSFQAAIQAVANAVEARVKVVVGETGDGALISATTTGDATSAKTVTLASTAKLTAAVASAESALQSVSATGDNYISIVAGEKSSGSQTITASADVSTTISAATSGGTQLADAYAVKTFVENKIEALDYTSTGAAGSFIQNVSETDGVIAETVVAFDSAITSSSTIAPQSKAVYGYVAEIEKTVSTALNDLETRKEDKSNKITSITSAATDVQYASAKATKAYADAIKVNNVAQVNQNITVGGANIDLSGYTKGSSSAAVAATDTVNQAIGKLENQIDAAVAGGLQGVDSGYGINVSAVANNRQTISAKIKTGEKALAADASGLSTTLKIQFNTTAGDHYRNIQLLGIDDEIISEFNASQFVKDGMLYDQVVSAATAEVMEVTFPKKGDKNTYSALTIGHTYIFLEFNNDGEKSFDKLDATKLVDVYTAGDGLQVSNNKFSLRMNEANGLALSGATVGEKTLVLNTVVASTGGTGGSNGAMTAAQAEKLDGIESGAQVNVIESIALNGSAFTISSKAATLTLVGSDFNLGGTGAHSGSTIDVAVEGAYAAIADLNVSNNVSTAVHGVTVQVDEVSGKVQTPVITIASGSVASGNDNLVTGGQVYTADEGVKTTLIGVSGDPTSANTIWAAKNYAKAAVDELNYTSIGAAGSFVQNVSETKGVIAETIVAFDSAITSSSTIAPQTKAVYKHVDDTIKTLDADKSNTANDCGTAATTQIKVQVTELDGKLDSVAVTAPGFVLSLVDGDDVEA